MTIVYRIALILILFVPCTSSALEYELQNLRAALNQLADFLEPSSTPESEFYAKFEPVIELSRNIERLQAYDLDQLIKLDRELIGLSQEANDIFGTDVPRDIARALDSVRSKEQERRSIIMDQLLHDMLLRM